MAKRQEEEERKGRRTDVGMSTLIPQEGSRSPSWPSGRVCGVEGKTRTKHQSSSGVDDAMSLLFSRCQLTSA